MSSLHNTQDLLRQTKQDMVVLHRGWVKKSTRRTRVRESITRPDMGSKRTLYGTAFPLSHTPSGRTPVIIYDKDTVAEARRSLLSATTPREALPSRIAFTRTGYYKEREDMREADESPHSRTVPLSGPDMKRARHRSRSSKHISSSGPGSKSRGGRSNLNATSPARPARSARQPLGGGSRSSKPESSRPGRGARGRANHDSPAPGGGIDGRQRLLQAKFTVAAGPAAVRVDQDAALAHFASQISQSHVTALQMTARFLHKWRASVTGIIATKYLVNKVAEVARIPRGAPDMKVAAAVLACWLRAYARRTMDEYQETHHRLLGDVKEWMEREWGQDITGLPADDTRSTIRSRKGNPRRRPASARVSRGPAPRSTAEAATEFLLPTRRARPGSAHPSTRPSTARKSVHFSGATAGGIIGSPSARSGHAGMGMTRTVGARPSSARSIRKYLETRGPPTIVDGPRMHLPLWVGLVKRVLNTPVVDRLVSQFVTQQVRGMVGRFVAEAPTM